MADNVNEPTDADVDGFFDDVNFGAMDDAEYNEMMESNLKLGPDNLVLGPSDLIRAVVPVPGTD